MCQYWWHLECNEMWHAIWKKPLYPLCICVVWAQLLSWFLFPTTPQKNATLQSPSLSLSSNPGFFSCFDRSTYCFSQMVTSWNLPPCLSCLLTSIPSGRSAHVFTPSLSPWKQDSLGFIPHSSSFYTCFIFHPSLVPDSLVWVCTWITLLSTWLQCVSLFLFSFFKSDPQPGTIFSPRDMWQCLGNIFVDYNLGWGGILLAS